MIPGTTITLGGKKYLLPPMNVEAMELHGDFITACVNGKAAEGQDMGGLVIIADLIYLSLARNYPDITRAEVKRHVDLGNMQALLASVFKTSGFEEKAPGEALPGNGLQTGAG